MNHQETEALANRDYQAHKGKIILANVVSGYLGDDGCDSGDYYFNPPIAVRIVRQDIADCQRNHWTDDQHLDPYWDVDIIDLEHPQLPKEGLRSTWIFGISYPEDSRSEWVVETRWQRVCRWYNRLLRKFRRPVKKEAVV